MQLRTSSPSARERAYEDSLNQGFQKRDGALEWGVNRQKTENTPTLEGAQKQSLGVHGYLAFASLLEQIIP